LVTGYDEIVNFLDKKNKKRSHFEFL